MAACGSLHHIFEKPLPENPTLLESLSPWNQIKPRNPIEDSSFTEIFGELHFKEKTTFPSSQSSSRSRDCSSTYNNRSKYDETCCSLKGKGKGKGSDGFSHMNSESLHFCTEGLGFESSDDVEDLKGNMNNDDERGSQKERPNVMRNYESLRSRSSGGALPPPISSIGKSGKPWVCFKSYRHDGRFVLKEVRIPTQEFLHAYREDGRLKLQFVQSDDEILDQDEDEEEEEEEREDDDVEEYRDDADGEDEHGHNCDKTIENTEKKLLKTSSEMDV